MRKLDLPIEDIVEKYESGFSTSQIAKQYDCSVGTIQRRLKEAGVKFRPIGHGCRKYSLNDNYFNDINNEHKAYWLGIFLTIGSTSSELIRLSLKKDDEFHLRKFLNDISSTHPIKYQCKDDFLQACVSIGSKHMRKNLVNKGIVTKKKQVFPVSQKLEKHYWRGVFDGHGTIDIDNKQIRITGTRHICQKFKTFCKKHVHTNANLRKHDNMWKFSLHGNVAFKIIELIYKGSSIFLDRKYDQYVKWAEIYAGEPMYPKVAKFFREILPQKVSIQRCKVPNDLEGDCTYHNGEYLIRVSNTLSDNEAINCLLHELSHIDTMLKQKDPHGSAFGIAYSKIYKIYESEFT